MAVLDGAEVIYHDKVDAPHTIKLSSVIGGRNPAHSTGVGKDLDRPVPVAMVSITVVSTRAKPGRLGE